MGRPLSESLCVFLSAFSPRSRSREETEAISSSLKSLERAGVRGGVFSGSMVWEWKSVVNRLGRVWGLLLR
jgi:hypothetical protein